MVGSHAEAQIINPNPTGKDYRVWGGPEKPAQGLREIVNAIRTALGGRQFGSVIADSDFVPRGVPAGATSPTLVRVPLPFDKAVAEAGRYVGLWNAAQARYSSTGPNSNTVAYGLSEFLGGSRATPPILVPGNNSPLPF